MRWHVVDAVPDSELFLRWLQHAAKAPDRYFHEVLYNTLVELRAVPQMLELDNPHLERHLRTSGGLPPYKGPLQPGTAIGPLSPNQVSHYTLFTNRSLQISGNLQPVAAMWPAACHLGESHLIILLRSEPHQAALSWRGGPGGCTQQ